ncbi:MAG: MFS transporter [Hydrogenothermaceae bacterium]
MKKTLSFSLFDTGETILGALIFSTFFPLYITNYIDPKIYSYTYSFAFLVSFLFALHLGKIADRYALRKQFFITFVLITTLLCISLFFTTNFPALSLLIFVLMAVSHQQSFVFYNSLLLDFQSRGLTSGIGVSFGYIGSAVALIFLADKLSIPLVYLVVAFLFLTLSLPSMVFLENPKISTSVSLKEIFKDKKFLLTILSILSITEVANTLIAMMGIYLKKVFGFEDIFVYKIIGLSAVGGILGGIFWGFLSDRLSATKIFPIGFFIWSLLLLSLPFVTSETVLLFGFFAGFSLSHLWTVSRVYIIEEFSAKEVSTRMSFLSLTERIAATTGLFIWGTLLYLTNDNYPLSAASMSVFTIAGFFVYILSKKIT